MALYQDFQGGLQVLQILQVYTIKTNLPFLGFNNKVAPNIYQNIEENLRSKNPDLIRPFPWENPSFHWGTNAQNAIYIDKEITNFMGKCI